jgi:hypothetical protein
MSDKYPEPLCFLLGFSCLPTPIVDPLCSSLEQPMTSYDFVASVKDTVTIVHLVNSRSKHWQELEQESFRIMKNHRECPA